jgi:hypothetical protein
MLVNVRALDHGQCIETATLKGSVTQARLSCGVKNRVRYSRSIKEAGMTSRLKPALERARQIANYLPGTGGTVVGTGATAVVSVGVFLSVAAAAIRSARARLATRTAAAKPGCSGVMVYASHGGLSGRCML